MQPAASKNELSFRRSACSVFVGVDVGLAIVCSSRQSTDGVCVATAGLSQDADLITRWGNMAIGWTPRHLFLYSQELKI